MNNPSLRQEPRFEPAVVIPLVGEGSLLDWLQASGRLIPRDIEEEGFDTEDEEISDLMDGDDRDYTPSEEQASDD